MDLKRGGIERGVDAQGVHARAQAGTKRGGMHSINVHDGGLQRAGGAHGEELRQKGRCKDNSRHKQASTSLYKYTVTLKTLLKYYKYAEYDLWYNFILNFCFSLTVDGSCLAYY